MATTYRVEVDAPEAYDGNADFDDWMKRLLAYLSLSDIRYKIIAEDYILNATQPSMRADLTQRNDNDPTRIATPQEAAAHMAMVLYTLLLQLCKRPAYAAVVNVQDDNGFESLRQMKFHYGKSTRLAMITTLMKIVNQKFDENHLAQSLTTLEYDVAELERSAETQLPDLLKTTFLIMAVIGGVHKYQCLNIEEVITYEHARKIVLNYSKTSQMQLGTATSNSRSSTTTVPMEIGAIRRKFYYR